ncbi:hypothetical protein [Glutamicibacter sp. M10]|uniref:hypothetical protein n=1 Tax=Glutamicibacter sp. M10 TaxID=3023076 RepID=UPI0021C635F6|nr:hypothetical protein [Glutamicibacter sp. M10]UXN31703.1 hypothetical protein N6V40_15475 [Glutamicibacter sp. M10]
MSEFFQWLAGVPPLGQIPIVLLVFGVLVFVILAFVELATKRGRAFTIVRLAAAVLVPVIILLILGLYNSVMWVAAIAAVLGAILFFMDRRSRHGAGSLLQLTGFLAPAALLLAIGLIYPTIRTAFSAFMANDGSGFVGLSNFAWVFTSPDGVTALLNTLVWVLVAPVVSTIIGLAYAVFIDKSRGEKFFKLLVFMPMAISFVGASIILSSSTTPVKATRSVF